MSVSTSWRPTKRLDAPNQCVCTASLKDKDESSKSNKSVQWTPCEQEQGPQTRVNKRTESHQGQDATFE